MGNLKEKKGLQLLIERYRKMFRIPENIHYYTADAYKKAERKYVKAILKGDL